MKIIKADILTNIDPNKQTIILHGCNCFHVMGGGIAAYLKKQYPEIYETDVHNTTKGDRKKLGTFSMTIVKPNLYIANCYTQYNFGFVNIHVDYVAIRECLQKIRLLYDDWEIRSPQIGCGLAGGDWKTVKKIYEEDLVGCDCTIYHI